MAFHSPDGKNWIYDRDRIPWHEAPVPPRHHTCTAWTEARSDNVIVQRCACGGGRVALPEKPGVWSAWGADDPAFARNSRRNYADERAMLDDSIRRRVEAVRSGIHKPPPRYGARKRAWWRFW